MGENEDKVHLSPAEAEIGTELGNIFYIGSGFDFCIWLKFKNFYDLSPSKTNISFTVIFTILHIFI